MNLCDTKTTSIQTLRTVRMSFRVAKHFLITPFNHHIKNRIIPLAAGWTIAAFGILQLPLWCIYAIIKQKGDTWTEKIQGAFRPKSSWGPRYDKNFTPQNKIHFNLNFAHFIVIQTHFNAINDTVPTTF